MTATKPSIHFSFTKNHVVVTQGNFVHPRCNILESGVHKVSLSDHYMVFCKRKVNAGLGGSHKLIIMLLKYVINASSRYMINQS